MTSAEAQADGIEEIPDDAEVCRAYFEPADIDSDELAPETYFSFTYDKDRDERAESVYWRKYAPTVDDVHKRACALEKKWALLAPEVSELKYIGARTARAGEIRSIVTGRGHRFRVIHYPQDGDRAHAHISVERAGGNVKKLSANDKRELVALVMQCFRGFEPHQCT